jgi:hypothetical protein
MIPHLLQVTQSTSLSAILSRENVSTIADWAGIIGIPFALIGLRLAFKEAQRAAHAARAAKSASEAAVTAVQRFREDLTLINNVAEFTKALSMMDEMKRFMRHSAFVPLPDRLSETRKLLISIRLNTPGLSEDEQAIFQNTILNFQGLEKRIDRYLLKEIELKDIAAINEQVSADIDALQEILSAIRSKIGETDTP